jgi:hypothetical protein
LQWQKKQKDAQSELDAVKKGQHNTADAKNINNQGYELMR